MNNEQATSPLRAIKLFCRNNCCAVGPDNHGSMEAWKECNISSCQLHAFREGKNPFRKRRDMTDEQRKAIGERLQNSRIS